MSVHAHLYRCMILALVFAGALPAVAAAPSLSERRERVEKMDPAEKQELLERQERFAALDPAEQERLRKLDQALADDPQADQLRRTLEKYYEWLRTLDDPALRAELLALPWDQRLARVKELRAAQAKAARRKLGREDLRAVAEWMGPVILAKLQPADRDRIAALGELPLWANVGMLAKELWRTRADAGWGLANELTEQEIETLKDVLSAKARQQLDAGMKLQDRQKLVGHWMGQVFRHSWQAEWRERGGMGAEFARFLKEGITPEQQGKFRALPEHERQGQIFSLYRQWRIDQNLPPLPEALPPGDARPWRDRQRFGPPDGQPRRPKPQRPAT